MTKHFYVIDKQGVAHTRSSKTRTYTHTVLFRFGQAIADRRLAEALAYTEKQAPKNYDFHLSMTDGRWREESEARFGRDLYSDAHWEQEKANHLAHLDGLDVAGYTARCLQEVRDRHAARVAAGEFTKFHNAGWCGRLDLAHKLAAQQEAEEVVIMEASEGKPPKA